MPSRAADRDEFLALAGALRDHAGTMLEFIPAVGEISAERMELMADMSLADDRPLNWNLLAVTSQNPDGAANQLKASDYAAELGATVVAVGRPVLWGLIVGGASGVKSVYGHLAGEMKSAMLLSGVAKATDIRREHVVLAKV